MSEQTPPADERASQFDAALAGSQREEREQRDADLARQAETDERIVRVLSGPDD